MEPRLESVSFNPQVFGDAPLGSESRWKNQGELLVKLAWPIFIDIGRQRESGYYKIVYVK
jgi:hypothetical protein